MEPSGTEGNLRGAVSRLADTMIRYPNIIFAGGSVGKAPRESRSGVHVLEDDMHNLINGSV